MHCFGGCGAVDVMDSIGLSLRDLYPERGSDQRPIRKPYMPQDVLAILQHEVGVCAVIGADVINGKPHDQARLMESWERIETIGRMAYGRG